MSIQKSMKFHNNKHPYYDSNISTMHNLSNTQANNFDDVLQFKKNEEKNPSGITNKRIMRLNRPTIEFQTQSTLSITNPSQSENELKNHEVLARNKKFFDSVSNKCSQRLNFLQSNIDSCFAILNHSINAKQSDKDNLDGILNNAICSITTKFEDKILKTSEKIDLVLNVNLINDSQQNIDLKGPILNQYENLIKKNIPEDHISNICNAKNLIKEIEKKIVKIENCVTKGKFEVSPKLLPVDDLINKSLEVIKSDFMDDIFNSLKRVNKSILNFYKITHWVDGNSKEKKVSEEVPKILSFLKEFVSENEFDKLNIVEKLKSLNSIMAKKNAGKSRNKLGRCSEVDKGNDTDLF